MTNTTTTITKYRPFINLKIKIFLAVLLKMAEGKTWLMTEKNGKTMNTFGYLFIQSTATAHHCMEAVNYLKIFRLKKIIFRKKNP